MLCIQRVVAFTICWFLWLVWFVCVSLDQVEYRALTRARTVHLYASGQLRPWPYYTLSAADTPLQPAPTRQGTSSTKTSTVHVRPNIRYPQTAYPRMLVLCWTVGSRSEMSFSRTGRTTHRWRTTVGERVLYAKCAWMAPEHRTSETMTKSDDWSVVLVFYLAIAMIRDCEPHLSHNNILNALER